MANMQMLISVTEEVKTEPGEYSITPLINFSNLIELTFYSLIICKVLGYFLKLHLLESSIYINLFTSIVLI